MWTSSLGRRKRLSQCRERACYRHHDGSRSQFQFGKEMTFRVSERFLARRGETPALDARHDTNDRYGTDANTRHAVVATYDYV